MIVRRKKTVRRTVAHPSCAHHWVTEKVNRSTSRTVCRICGERHEVSKVHKRVVEGSSPNDVCRHQWVIKSKNGSTGTKVCSICGEERQLVSKSSDGGGGSVPTRSFRV
jgi:transcription elongation factor Elf1